MRAYVKAVLTILGIAGAVYAGRWVYQRSQAVEAVVAFLTSPPVDASGHPTSQKSRAELINELK